MMAFDTLLFDLDGTLVDSTRDLTTSINLLRRDNDLPPLAQATVADYVGDGTALLVRRSLPEGLYAEKQLTRFLAIYSEHLLETTLPYAGILSLLEACRDRAMAVVTNKPLRQSLTLLENLGLKDFFQAVVGGDSTARKKPSPEPLAKALSMLGRKPEEALMIGDHANDLLAGRAAGTRTCFCAWGTGNHLDIPRDLQAATPAALQKLLLDRTA